MNLAAAWAGAACRAGAQRGERGRFGMAKLVRIWRRGFVAALPLAAALAIVLGGVAATPAQAQWPGGWGVPWGGMWGAPWTGLGYGFPGWAGSSMMSGYPMSSSMGSSTS